MIDRRFLEFLGNSFLSAARGQAQLEEMTAWFRKSLAGMENMPAPFLRAYGMDAGPKGDPDRSAAAKNAMEDFQKAYGAWIRIMGAVPLSEYQKLEARCEALEKENEEQARMIRYLSGVISGEGDMQTATLTALKDLTQKQTEQFGSLVRAFSEYLQGRTGEAPSTESEPPGREAGQED